MLYLIIHTVHLLYIKWSSAETFPKLAIDAGAISGDPSTTCFSPIIILMVIIILYIILRWKSVISINPRRANTTTQKPIVLISFRNVFHKILHQCRIWEGFMHQFAVKSHKTRGARRWCLNTDVVHIEDHNPHGLWKVILVHMGSDYRLGIADVGPRTSVHVYTNKEL